MKVRFNMRNELMVIVIAVLFSLVWTAETVADTTWTNTGTGAWETGSNWDNGEPTISDTAYINNDGTAIITANGEECSWMYIGQGAGNKGAVQMDSGTLYTDGLLYVGRDGYGRFDQNGGSNSVNQLLVGIGTGSDGIYFLDGGTLTVRSYIRLADYTGNAKVYQRNDSQATIHDMYVSYIGSSSVGRYYLQNTAKLTVTGTARIGSYNSGYFYQYNETEVDWQGPVYLGYHDSAYGSYSFYDSSSAVFHNYLKIGSIAGSVGRLSLYTNTASITIKGTMYLGDTNRVYITAAAGTKIHMDGGSFENLNDDDVRCVGLNNIEFIFEGGSAVTSNFEVAGMDMGRVYAGLTNNFALAGVTLGGVDVGVVRLMNSSVSMGGGDEALYVDYLNVGSGSTLDLNGQTLYYADGLIAGSVIKNGGSLVCLEIKGTTIIVR